MSTVGIWFGRFNGGKLKGKLHNDCEVEFAIFCWQNLVVVVVHKFPKYDCWPSVFKLWWQYRAKENQKQQKYAEIKVKNIQQFVQKCLRKTKKNAQLKEKNCTLGISGSIRIQNMVVTPQYSKYSGSSNYRGLP